MGVEMNKVALIGLGKMGSVLAKKLLEAGFDLTVYNRTELKMQPILAMGGKGATSAKEAAMSANIIMTSLFDDESVLEVVGDKNGILEGLKQGAIHIGTSTILPSTSKKLTKLHDQKNTIYISGNVLGVPKVAEKGELTSIIAGNQKAIASCMPVFNAYSKTIINVGQEAYKANVMKICTNYLLATTIECMGELYTFAEKNDVDAEHINKMFHTVFAHPAYQLYADKIKDRDFNNVNFDLKGGFKDLQLFQKAFTDVKVVPDLANIIINKFIIALAHGMENKDWSAVSDVTRQLAGLER